MARKIGETNPNIRAMPTRQVPDEGPIRCGHGVLKRTSQAFPVYRCDTCKMVMFFSGVTVVPADAQMDFAVAVLGSALLAEDARLQAMGLVKGIGKPS